MLFRSDHDAHGQEEHEQAQLLVRVPQSESQTLESGGVTGQLEDTQDPHDAEDLHDPPDVLELISVLIGLDQEERDEIRHDGQ